MFTGEHQHNLDAKGRLFIPARFRQDLGSRFVVTKGLDGCLFVYGQRSWETLQGKLEELPFSRAEARAFLRFFLSGAIEVEADRQGRIVLPQALRVHARLEREATVIGVGDRVEIWSTELWDVYQRESEADPEALAAKLGEWGLL